ncbi:nuclear pore complex protein Nup160 homolog [Condylostylus longicornis]|uniref:nuclear pore complex protein Nup160 homolog n=1 Tax=Condylostylus longicornis TaxID=2530218 RepID=UPI00244E357C|nr:nuclear pore complex protein Nup160 homolog [Condylostylus longicornis]
MEEFNLSYREVLPDLSTIEKWTEVSLNTGGTHSTLQDIKVAEKSGGYCYKDIYSKETHNRNRFIYWRTYHDVLELSEISLDFNLFDNNLRYKFTDSPVLSVYITEYDKFVTILVTTVSSLHKINFTHPNAFGHKESSETKCYSIFREANTNSVKDPSTYYVIGQNISSNNPVPHAAACYLSTNGQEAFFSLAYQNNLALFTMNCQNGLTVTSVLKETHIMPRIFSNIRGALGGKSGSIDSEFATSMVFSTVNGQTFLMALYRDDHLKMWTTASAQCVSVVNLIRDGSEDRLQGPQTNALRKINDRNLCAFLSHSMNSEFVCIKILSEGSTHYTLQKTKVIPAPQSDLADFEVSENKIWALWCNAQGEFNISNFSLTPGHSLSWISAAMEPPPDRYCIDPNVDPRQAYCSYIFHPGKFDRSVILKALVMFRRSNNLFDPNISMHILKDRVCQAVEAEIQNEIKEYEIADDEYVEIATRFWEKFYSCCEQYHMKASQPIGLVLLASIDVVCVVKKNTFSLLRPCETLEHLMIVGENIELSNFVFTHFDGNKRAGEDLINLVKILSQIEQWLPEDVKLDFDKKLQQLEMPDVVIADLVNEILSAGNCKEIFPRNFLINLRQQLQSVSDICSAMLTLLNSLRMDYGNPEAMQTHSHLAESSRFLFIIGNLFGSNIGISILSESVRQTSLIRYALCRNLLILQQILIDTISLASDVLETIRSKFMPEAVVFVQSYYVMIWICERPVNLNHSSSLESSIQRLNLLQLTETRPNLSAQIHSAPLLRVFLSSKGLYTALALFSEGPFKTLQDLQWQYTLIPLVTIISQLIWPVSGNFVFGEWLFGSCQHIVIQEYVRLLNKWCEWNNSSRQFILAVSLLDNGEVHKAYDLFLQSANGVHTEQFLIERILKNATNLTLNEALAKYYLKVIQLFEQHNSLDNIIAMAQVAIGILDKNDSQLPMFQSIVFNSHLVLEHYEEAYHSLIFNAEPSRRKDCLRQLVVSLFNKKRLDLLLHFEYAGLQEEFENILESRARSMAIEENEVYNFLYAFYVNKDNMRKASSCMYEQALRLQLESDCSESIQKRYDSLLMCLNTLYLVDERFQWIVRPILSDEPEDPDAMETDETHSEPDDDGKSKVTVYEIKDIRKELLHTEACLILSKHRQEVGTSLIKLGVKELSQMLLNAGHYTSAIKLLKGFDLNLCPAFESLTAACVRTAEEGPSQPWTWLQENDLADLPHKNNAADTAWALLQKQIEDHELTGFTAIRKAVVNKLLNLQVFLPRWLYNSYKHDNVAELLRLFVNHSRLLEAAELTKELIRAALGSGHEYFNIKHPLAANTPSLCIPLYPIDLLLYGLRINFDTDDEYRHAHLELEELIEEYVQTAGRASEDKIRLAIQLVAQNKKERLKIA